MVSVVETPYVPDIGNFVVATSEELLEVFCGLNQLWQPDQSWKVSLSARDMSASKIHRMSVCDS